MALWIWSNPGPIDSSKKTPEPVPVERKETNSILDRKGKVPRCCLCNKKMAPGGLVIEERPTADDGSMQEWFYCPSCWVELRKLREPGKSRKRFVATCDSSLDLKLD